MKYKEKVEKFKERTYFAQGLVRVDDKWTPIDSNQRPRWKNKKELSLYLEAFGGSVKEDKRRRKGYLVSKLTEDVVAEVPLDFAEKVLAFGFP